MQKARVPIKEQKGRSTFELHNERMLKYGGSNHVAGRITAIASRIMLTPRTKMVFKWSVRKIPSSRAFAQCIGSQFGSPVLAKTNATGLAAFGSIPCSKRASG